MSETQTPGQLAQMACLIEATARKPGNVHRYADFADATWLDFALSAGAIVGPLDRASALPLGATIRASVVATQAVVATNTNLGMILLLAPLAAVGSVGPLRSGLTRVLAAATVADNRLVYEAIRLAKPGGLGRSDAGEDVANEPTVTLVEAMRLAADRDLIARQYALGFADVFDRFVPDLAAELARLDRTLETALVGAFLRFLADRPDTLIARKCGLAVAAEASRRAGAVLAAGWPDSSGGVGELARLDGWLRADGHRRNPGATADLAAAGLYVALREGIISRPIVTNWKGGPFVESG